MTSFMQLPGLKQFILIILPVAVCWERASAFQIIPPPPQQLQSVTLKWSPSVSPNVTQYIVLTSTNSGTTPVFISTNTTTATNITIGSLPRTRLYFWIAAVNNEGVESGLSGPYSFSGWNIQTWLILGSSTDYQTWSSQDILQCTNSCGYYRVGVQTTKTGSPPATQTWVILASSTDLQAWGSQKILHCTSQRGIFRIGLQRRKIAVP
jgi:hypothetical protein